MLRRSTIKEPRKAFTLNLSLPAEACCALTPGLFNWRPFKCAARPVCVISDPQVRTLYLRQVRGPAIIVKAGFQFWFWCSRACTHLSINVSLCSDLSFLTFVLVLKGFWLTAAATKSSPFLTRLFLQTLSCQCSPETTVECRTVVYKFHSLVVDKLFCRSISASVHRIYVTQYVANTCMLMSSILSFSHTRKLTSTKNEKTSVKLSPTRTVDFSGNALPKYSTPLTPQFSLP